MAAAEAIVEAEEAISRGRLPEPLRLSPDRRDALPFAPRSEADDLIPETTPSLAEIDGEVITARSILDDLQADRDHLAALNACGYAR